MVPSLWMVCESMCPHVRRSGNKWELADPEGLQTQDQDTGLGMGKLDKISLKVEIGENPQLLV